MAICIQCQGAGNLQGDYPACPSCNGRGDNGMDRRLPCPSCRGSGKADTRRYDSCWNCGGTGRVADPPKPSPSDGKKAKTKKGAGASTGSGKSSEGGFTDKFGGFVAFWAAIAAAAYGYQQDPENPWLWLIFGVLGAAVTFALRKLILWGGIIFGALWLFGQSEDADQPVQVASAVPLAVAGADRGGTTEVVGLCLMNNTTQALDYYFEHEDRPRSETHTLRSGHTGWHWWEGNPLPSIETPLRLDVDAVRSYWEVDLGRRSFRHDGPEISGDDIPCGGSGLPKYIFEYEGGDLIIRS